MEQLYFSIIIPIYNREHTLSKCIESILSQTYPYFELLLVDDNSTDNSITIAKNYKLKDKRINFFQQDKNNLGAQAARNTGIRNAKFDWIMFNDSDDYWASDKIEKEYLILKKYNFQKNIIIYSDCNTINVKTNEKKLWSLPHISEDDSYSNLLIQSGPMFQSLLCSKKQLEEINYLDESVPSYQEWDTSIRLAKNGKFIHIQEPLFDYTIGGNDAISKSLELDFIGRSNIYIKFKNEIIKYHGLKVFKKICAENYIFALQNVNFNQLVAVNQIIYTYKDILIKLFGKKYHNKCFSIVYGKSYKIKNFIKKYILSLFKKQKHLL